MSGIILVVDDDVAIREFVHDALDNEGYSVILAENGSQALALAAKEQPGLILLDMRMPVLDGFGFLHAFCHTGSESTPVIAMSAHMRGKELGSCVNDYLEKPFELDRLLSLVEKYV